MHFKGLARKSGAFLFEAGCPISRAFCAREVGFEKVVGDGVLFIRHIRIQARRSTISFVPSHLKRYYGAGDLHFITCSCYQRQPVLGSPEPRDLFLTVLENVRLKYSLVILGYVVMPEHFHLLISEPQEQTPSVVMQALKLGFARRVQSTMLKSGKVVPSHIWQRRFYDFNLRTEAKRIEKLRYMHRNPVTRGLVKRPEQWQWSSFRYYANREAGPVRINAWEVLKMKMRSVG